MNKEVKKKKSTLYSNILAIGILVLIVFILLRLANVIMWHWLWVTSPFWGSIVFVMFLSLIKSIVKDFKIWLGGK